MSLVIDFGNCADGGLSARYDSMKKDLSEVICSKISDLDMTQNDLAEQLQTDQPKISQVVNGQISGFSVKRLCVFAELLGGSVTLYIRCTKTNSVVQCDGIHERIDEIKLTICELISDKIMQCSMTQCQVAAHLKIDQPKVSQMKNRKINGFSMERLCSFAVAFDYEVKLKIEFPSA